MTTLAFIINYQRLSLPAKMADYLAGCPGIRPIIIDNNSDYSPLLEYYETTSHEVLRLDFNYGSAAPWHPAAGVLDRYDVHGMFVVTDPDLDIAHVPSNWLGVLKEGLDRYSFACKSGFSLRIDDLPDTPIGNEARRFEAGNWAFPLDGKRFYKAFIDTTFCLCRTRLHDFPAVRSAPPYTARHMPWYYKSLADISEDELYYMESTKSRGSTYWTSRIREALA